MLPVRIIAQKRDGEELSDQQIAEFVQGYSQEQIPDYQMSALAMAIFLNGMTVGETAALTQAMLDSGTRLTWPEDGVPRVDKHSTGGIGDKVSLILAPLLAACDLQVPMLSGRGLGPTGGTLDKLEAIPGFRTQLSLDEIRRTVADIGCVITGATSELAPADRRLYGLRDVTGTVPSIPLITASIMSKKLAESPDALVLDVKFGSGAFMKTSGQARQLAESLVQTGSRMGVHTTALLTSMNQPLGRMCGNAVEVNESLQVLQGGGPADVRELTLQLASELLQTGHRQPAAEALLQAQQALDDGSAFDVFQRMVHAQDGRLQAPLETAPTTDVVSLSSGVVSAIDVEQLGYTIIAMGGGRQQLSDSIDHSVGVEMLVRPGDPVTSGQPVLRVFHHQPERFQSDLRRCVTISDSTQPVDDPLILDRIIGSIP